MSVKKNVPLLYDTDALAALFSEIPPEDLAQILQDVLDYLTGGKAALSFKANFTRKSFKNNNLYLIKMRNALQKTKIISAQSDNDVSIK